MKIAVVGLGKIGLPLAAQFSDKGHEVIGIDINADTVATVNAGTEPFPGEAHLQEHLRRLVPAGRLRATTSYLEAIPGADVIVVVVPLFVDAQGRPDFASMDASTRDIAKNLGRGSLIIYETTLPVGTTRNRWKPALESGSGLREGTDFHVVFSPERVLTGRVFEDLRKYPKLIGGLSPKGTHAAMSFYKQVLDFDERPDLERENGVWDLGSAEASEMAKLAETTYRDVNIGLANQFAMHAHSMGIDVYAVIEASNSQPYSHIHDPGIAVGGHCIPVYPRLYLANSPASTIVVAARQVNADMPKVYVRLLASHLAEIRSQHIVILGAAYRPGVKETAFSGVFPLRDELESLGARVSVHDPLYLPSELSAMGLSPYEAGDRVSAAVLHTDHPEFSELTSRDLPGLTVIVNGRNAALTGFRNDRDVHIITLGGSCLSATHRRG